MSEHLFDPAIGETREALIEGGRVAEVWVKRASDQGRRASLGEMYAARLTSLDGPRRGAYLELGLRDEQGFLPLDPKRRGKRPKLREGDSLVVAIAREAVRGKNPVVSLMGPGQGDPPGRIELPDAAAEAKGLRPVDPTGRARIDAAIEEALSRSAPVPGGGALLIEPTAALVAIDVDARGRGGSKDPEKFALDLNMAAAAEAARQVRLRGLGGLIAIDFVSVREEKSKRALEAAVKAAFARDPWGVIVGPLSRFGVVELARTQKRTPLHERLRDDAGRPTAETLALEALRAIEREARALSGRKIAATVSSEVMAFLDRTDIGWRHALTSRIGPRWMIDSAPAGAGRERIDVRAL